MPELYEPRGQTYALHAEAETQAIALRWQTMPRVSDYVVEIATDAAAAEEMLAQLQADNELADSVGTVAHAGMSAEEQALYEELEREAGGPETTKVALDHAWIKQESWPINSGIAQGM